MRMGAVRGGARRIMKAWPLTFSNTKGALSSSSRTCDRTAKVVEGSSRLMRDLRGSRIRSRTCQVRTPRTNHSREDRGQDWPRVQAGEDGRVD